MLGVKNKAGRRLTATYNKMYCHLSFPAYLYSHSFIFRQVWWTSLTMQGQEFSLPQPLFSLKQRMDFHAGDWGSCLSHTSVHTSVINSQGNKEKTSIPCKTNFHLYFLHRVYLNGSGKEKISVWSSTMRIYWAVFALSESHTIVWLMTNCIDVLALLQKFCIIFHCCLSKKLLNLSDTSAKGEFNVGRYIYIQYVTVSMVWIHRCRHC